MAVRIGVDVGGTFTKAVACETETSEIVGRVVVPTTHASREGVVDGVVDSVARLAEQVESSGHAPVVLVAHSTTQAVNALLEGDTSTVGILGIGRRPDLRRARKRTRVGEIRLAPGRLLQTRHAFVDATAGPDERAIASAIDELVEHGAEVLCISEAFGVEDPRAEWLGLEVAERMGLPACAGHELTGLYGLEMRTVTGAINASILPVAIRTAAIVEAAIARDLPGVPLMVMRGDGGAADLASTRRRPIVTAFSGPAASVAGALRHLAVAEGVVVEVGGTSTNVSAIRGGRPVLAYVRVLDHVTCVRSLDVRVVGVAGGSLLRMRRSMGRLRLDDVGPRSAHIAGLRYACFADADELVDAVPRLVAPRTGDPAEYVALELRNGERVALTLTCAANALEQVHPGTYARGNARAARAGFEALARATGLDWRAVAAKALDAAASRIASAIAEAVDEHALERPTIVGLGGAAGAVLPALGRASGLQWTIPDAAEVISSVGDALSLVRAEVERVLTDPSQDDVARLHRDAQRAAIAAGAAPQTVQLESHAVPEKRALRVVALGSVALEADTSASAWEPSAEDLRLIAKQTLRKDVDFVAGNGFYAVFVSSDGDGDFVVVDMHGSLASRGRGVVLSGPGRAMAGELRTRLTEMARHLGPVLITPSLRLLRGAELVDLSLLSAMDKLLDAALAQCELAGDDEVVALVTKS